jgi:hypothetical protein
MKRSGADEIRTLPFLHSLLILGSAASWVYYCWTESPLRIGGGGRGSRIGSVNLDHALAILNASMADVLLGFCSILLFAVGTGAYVRRVQTWIDARSSGDAVAYGGVDLKDQALAANTDRQRGK